VPLSTAAQEIIDQLDEVAGNEYVFVGRRVSGHLDPGTPLQKAIKKASGVDDFFFHAIRHTVETRLAELRIQPHIRDLLLDHAWQRGAGAGYDHHDYLPEMRSAMEAWTDKLRQIVTGKEDDKVVPLKKRGA
jgi:integrase